MSFLSHRARNLASRSGTVDHRLARQSVIDQYKRGRIARHEVCDAHPDLRRAAKEVAEKTKSPCPICEEANVVLVSYVFGPRLPKFGRCITSREELQKFASKATEKSHYTCFVIEVCPECSWNHLAQTLLLGK